MLHFCDAGVQTEVRPTGRAAPGQCILKIPYLDSICYAYTQPKYFASVLVSAVVVAFAR